MLHGRNRLPPMSPRMSSKTSPKRILSPGRGSDDEGRGVTSRTHPYTPRSWQGSPQLHRIGRTGLRAQADAG